MLPVSQYFDTNRLNLGRILFCTCSTLHKIYRSAQVCTLSSLPPPPPKKTKQYKHACIYRCVLRCRQYCSWVGEPTPHPKHSPEGHGTGWGGVAANKLSKTERAWSAQLTTSPAGRSTLSRTVGTTKTSKHQKK